MELVAFGVGWIYWEPDGNEDKEGAVIGDEILTLKEVAKLLKVAEKTVYTMAQRKECPAFKVRGQWRFRREDMDRWIEERKAQAAEEGSNE